MRIGLASLDQAWENKDANFQVCRSIIQRAKLLDVELVIFPEMTLTSYSMNIHATAEQVSDSVTVSLFKKLAYEFNVSIIFGVVFKDGDKAKNNALFVDSSGKIKGRYGKIHPFSFAGEDRFFNAGNEICIVDFKGVSIGLTICYDLRFPEIYSALGNRCKLIVNIANWPAKRIDHWNTLLKARAIENQLFVAGVNRVGMDANGLEYVKSSLIVSPNGELLKAEVSENEIDIFNVDLEYIEKFRQTFSTVQDRKTALYRAIL